MTMALTMQTTTNKKSMRQLLLLLWLMIFTLYDSNNKSMRTFFATAYRIQAECLLSTSRTFVAELENGIFNNNLFQLTGNETIDSTFETKTVTNSLNQTVEISYEVVQECDCLHEGGLHYCEATATHCALATNATSSSSARVTYTVCLNQDKAVEILRLLYQIFFFATLVILFLSRTGQNTMGFVISKCNKNFNDTVATRIMEYRPELMQIMIQNYFMYRLRHLEQSSQRAEQVESLQQQAQEILASPSNGGNNNVEFVLPTREYTVQNKEVQATSATTPMPESHTEISATETMVNNNNNINTSIRSNRDEGNLNSSNRSFSLLSGSSRRLKSDDFDNLCTICYIPLENGDKVGVMPDGCTHTFHVECLKSWLPRRNVCPLCLEPNVAIPKSQLQERLHGHETNNEDNNNGNNDNDDVQQEDEQEIIVTNDRQQDEEVPYSNEQEQATNNNSNDDNVPSESTGESTRGHAINALESQQEDAEQRV